MRGIIAFPDTISKIISVLTSNYRQLIVAAFLLLFTANLGQTFFLSVFNEELSRLAQMEISELGNWYAIATLAAGLGMHFSGPLIDHYSYWRMSLIVLLGIALGGILMALAPHGINLLIIYFLLRFFGQGMASHIAYTSVSRENHPRRGVAISLIATAMPAGEAVLPIISIILLGIISWSQFWLSLTALAVFLIVIAILVSPKKDFDTKVTTISEDLENNPTSATGHFSRRQVLRTAKFWVLVISSLYPAFSITALFFHQQIWLTAKHLTVVQFAFGLSLYAVTHILGSLVFGWLVDKIGLKPLLKIYMIPMLLSVMSLVWLSGENSLVIFMLLAGITVGAAGPVTGSLWPTLYGSLHLGAIRGTITALMVISTAIAPALVGWLDSLGWQSNSLLLLLTGYGLIATIALFFVNSKQSIP